MRISTSSIDYVVVYDETQATVFEFDIYDWYCILTLRFYTAKRLLNIISHFMTQHLDRRSDGGSNYISVFILSG